MTPQNETLYEIVRKSYFDSLDTVSMSLTECIFFISCIILLVLFFIFHNLLEIVLKKMFIKIYKLTHQLFSVFF